MNPGEFTLRELYSMAQERTRYDWNLFSPVLATIINAHSCAKNLLSLDAFILPEDDIETQPSENIITDKKVKKSIGKQLQSIFHG